MYHHLNLKVQVLTLLKIFKSVFQYIFCSQNNHFLAVWFLGVIFKLFLTPHREGEKVPKIFLAENERSHQYASNKVQTITYKRFLLTQSTFLWFFGLTSLHGLLPTGCAINKLVGTSNFFQNFVFFDFFDVLTYLGNFFRCDCYEFPTYPIFIQILPTLVLIIGRI